MPSITPSNSSFFAKKKMKRIKALALSSTIGADTTAPKECRREHPGWFSFVTINPKDQHEIDWNRECGRHHSDEQRNQPGLNSDQEKNDQSEQKSEQNRDYGSYDLDGSLNA